MRSIALCWSAVLFLPATLFVTACDRSPTSPYDVTGPRFSIGSQSSTTVYLHGSGGTANPPTLALDGVAPTGTTAKYKDSPSINFASGNPWKVVGTWTAAPSLLSGTPDALGDVHVWLGLKNSDDIGTRFDVRVEAYQNGTPVGSDESHCVQGITRNPNDAREVAVPVGLFAPTAFNGSTDVLSLKVLTRVGTNGTGGFCGGHSNAVGLRLYFDAVTRASRFDALFGCNTSVTVAVNDFLMVLEPGLLPSSPTITGQTSFQGTQVIFARGPLYGTSGADVVIGYHPRTGVSAIARGPICVERTAPFHHTVAALPLAPGVVGPAGLVATQESFAYPGSPDNGYVLLKYTFTNMGTTPITNFHSGMLADWDIYYDGNFLDRVRYDAGLGLGEVTEFDALAYPGILAFVPVGPSGPFSFNGYGGPGSDPPTIAGFFSLLSGGINLTVPANPRDIREMMGLAPVTIPPGQSTVAYFGIVGGANRTAFEANVTAAQAKAAALGF
jgi:hypothetical protein